MVIVLIWVLLIAMVLSHFKKDRFIYIPHCTIYTHTVQENGALCNGCDAL